MAELKDRVHFRGITLRSVSASLFAMAFIGSAINFVGAIAGFGGDYGTEALAITAIWVIVPLSLLGALFYRAMGWRMLTRPELFCILFSTLLASPLMAHGFWTFMLGRLATIPRSSDFEKLDAYPQKLWPHGSNLAAGKLEYSPGHDLSGKGGFEWKEVEVDEGKWALHPTVSNTDADEASSFLIPIEFNTEERAGLVPGKTLSAECPDACAKSGTGGVLLLPNLSGRREKLERGSLFLKSNGEEDYSPQDGLPSGRCLRVGNSGWVQGGDFGSNSG